MNLLNRESLLRVALSIGLVSSLVFISSVAHGDAPTVITFNSTPAGGTWTPPAGVTSVNVLVVAGGGGGGGSTGGGGGGGGLIYQTSYTVTPGSPVTVTVGGGGGGGSLSSHGSNGDNSVFGSLTAIGGGGGGDNQGGQGQASGVAGGSGGGASYGSSPGTKGSGTTAQGYDGGSNLPNGWPSGHLYSPGGGGGAGAVGANGSNSGSTGATGGDGVQSCISGSCSYYAGGGGGGIYFISEPTPGVGGAGGLGGGGTGGNGPSGARTDATGGTSNTGGGGGGQGGNVATLGGAGGSGVVILSYTTIPVVSSVMSSHSYTMTSDSINVAGGSASGSGKSMRDSVGEVATGKSQGSLYQVYAGYQPMQNSSISMTINQAPALSSLNGIVAGSSLGSLSAVVVTDNLSGYSLSIKSLTSPALQATTTGSSFEDYSPHGAVPDYTFLIAATSSAFGFSPEGPDIVEKFKDDGSHCGVGTYDTPNACWDGFSLSLKTVSQGNTNNQPGGATTTIKLHAEIGGSHIQDSGAYSSSLSLTAVAL